MVKRGTLIDATWLRPAWGRRATPRARQARGRTGPDADWTQRKGGGGSHFGYKAHVAVDQG